MRTSLQFFKDMGVCDGAYAVLERVFQSAGVTEFDYAAGYDLMLSMMDELETAAAQSGEPGHDTAEGWLKWCYDLRTRPEAIMYFGDHIEENLFRTAVQACRVDDMGSARRRHIDNFRDLNFCNAAGGVRRSVIQAELGAS